MSLTELGLKDPDWFPSGIPVASALIGIIPANAFVGLVESDIKATAEVRTLINDMLYAAAIDDDGKPVLEDVDGYRVDNFPKGRSPYQLIDLRKQERVYLQEGEDTPEKVSIPGFSATFQYTTGKKTPDGADAERIEYTMWHDPKSGLTILTNLHGYHAIEDGWLDIELETAAPDGLERAMAAKVYSSFGELLEFDIKGALKENSQEQFLWTSRELERIYLMITKRDAKVNALETALALIAAFPNDDPLLMHPMMVYDR